MERLFDSLPDYPDVTDATVKGNVPAWLNGRLYRLGPGKWDLGDFALNHWFDGCALLYRFSIEDGKVTFKSRFLNTDAYHKMCLVQRPVFTEFGTRAYPDPCKNVFSRFVSQLIPIEMTDNDFGNVFPIGDEIFCASETNYLWKVDPESLKTVDKVDLNHIVSVNGATSHPHQSREGKLYNLGTSYITGLKHHVIEIPPPAPKDGETNGARGFRKAKIIASIPSSWKTCFSYYHSFGMTDNFLLFVEQPLLVNSLKLAAIGVQGHSIKDCFVWSPKEKTRIHVIERETGHILKTRYQTDAFFFFHHVNAYEEDNQIVMDVMAFDTPDIIDKFYLEKLRAGLFDDTCPSQLMRIVLPLQKDGQKGENLVTLKGIQATAVRQENGVIFVQGERIGDAGFELPTINYGLCNGKKYRYVFGTGVFEQGLFRNSVVKLDVATHQIKVWQGTETMYPSEVILVQRPGGTEEDDGVLLSAVVDVNPDRPDFLLILDARTLEEIARAEIMSHIRIPPTIHGYFIKD